jgi:hypothetical protein
MTTWQTITNAIEAAGIEARQASFDAHGHAVPATVAYDSVGTMWAGNEDPRLELLPDSMPNGFVEAYRRGE